VLLDHLVLIGLLVAVEEEYTVQDTHHLLVVDLVDLMPVLALVELQVEAELIH
jgi:hypothetical protein